MIFEIGKYYRHPTGQFLRILCQIETTMYGVCLCAEVAGKSRHASNGLMPVGMDESCAQNYEECTEQDWMTNFETTKDIKPISIGSMTPEEQVDLWVEGKSVHNISRDECCPDFSCCGTPIVALETRLRFKAANEKEREIMLSVFLKRMLEYRNLEVKEG